MSFDFDLTTMLTTASTFAVALFGALGVVAGIKLAISIVKYIINAIGDAF